MTPANPSNPYKRHIDAVQWVYESTKRLKTQRDSEDSATSNVSDTSALIPTSVPEYTTEASEAESEDSEYVSELSESSEEPSDEGSDEDEDEIDAEEDEEEEEEIVGVQQEEEAVVNLPANRGRKPDFQLPPDEAAEDILPFLKDFLPKLKAANEELEAQKRAGTLKSSEIIGDEEGDTEEQYIEMNLGLGVLEEKGDDADTGATDEDEGIKDEQGDILDKLMGRIKREEPVGIQEVTDTQGNT